MALARRQKCARIGRKSPKISRSQTKSAAKTPNRPPKSAPPISNKPKGLVSGGAQLRGASNKLALLGPGVQAITASSGNHGIACSHAAVRTGAQLTVVLPECVAPAKAARIRGYGTDVIIHGEHSGLAEAHARHLAQLRDIAYISPYNDADIIAGQGTAGLEMLEQHPALDAVFISLGGGGLVSGIGSALKAARPSIKIYGVSARNSAVLAASIKAGHVLDVHHNETLADGVAGGMDQDALTLPIASVVIDELLWCSEDEIRTGLKAYAEQEHQIVEGAAGLGRVDGFDEDECGCDFDESSEISCGLFTTQGDAFEAFELSDGLLDAGSGLVEHEAPPVLTGHLG